MATIASVMRLADKLAAKHPESKRDIYDTAAAATSDGRACDLVLEELHGMSFNQARDGNVKRRGRGRQRQMDEDYD